MLLLLLSPSFVGAVSCSKDTYKLSHINLPPALTQVLYPDVVGNGTTAYELILEMVNGTSQPTIYDSDFPTQTIASVGATLSYR